MKDVSQFVSFLTRPWKVTYQRTFEYFSPWEMKPIFHLGKILDWETVTNPMGVWVEFMAHVSLKTSAASKILHIKCMSMSSFFTFSRTSPSDYPFKEMHTLEFAHLLALSFLINNEIMNKPHSIILNDFVGREPICLTVFSHTFQHHCSVIWK